MAIRDALLGELKHESSVTRRLLEVVPAADLGWRPHQKSFTLGRLAGHIAEIPGWLGGMLSHDHLDFGEPGAYEPFEATDIAGLLATHDRGVERSAEVLAGYDDAGFKAIWTLRRGDQVLVELPRLAAIRGFVLSHVIHHRGQLSVYLRLRDVPLPSVYGPTADEPTFG